MIIYIQERNKVLNTLEKEEISKINIDKTLNINCVNKNKPCTACREKPASCREKPAPCREKPAPCRVKPCISCTHARFNLQNIRKFYINLLHFINYLNADITAMKIV